MFFDDSEYGSGREVAANREIIEADHADTKYSAVYSVAGHVSEYQACAAKGRAHQVLGCNDGGGSY